MRIVMYFELTPKALTNFSQGWSEATTLGFRIERYQKP